MQQKSDPSKIEFDVARKLLTNADFTELHNRLNRFNVFEAFGHNEKEPRHTELLRYLLDPHETHGLGDALLRNVLLSLCDYCPQLASELFMLDIGATDVSSQNSKNERRIDLKVEIPYRGQNKDILILIEMKLRASQGKNQLANYSKDYADKENKICVYLTLDGEDSDRDEWLKVTYDSLILPAVKIAIEAFKDKIDPEILGLLKNYQEVLESFTTEEDLYRYAIIRKILKEIYTEKINNINWVGIKELPIMRSYRRAIDELTKRALEIENCPPMLRKFKGWCGDGGHKFYSSTGGIMRFLPSSLAIDTDFISASSNLAGTYKGNPWTAEPAALLFMIEKARDVNDESTGNNNVEVYCKIVLGPLKEGVDRDYYRTELKKIFETKGSSTNVWTTVGRIGKLEKFEDMIKTINDWLKNNQDKLGQIKQLILSNEHKVKE